MFYRLTLVAMWLVIAAAARADIQWGVNGHPITAYWGVSIERQMDFLYDLGARSYRVNISDEAGADVLAAVIAEGKKRGISILPVITPGNIDLDNDTTEELYRKAHQLAFALGSRFKEDIRVWELGNEMENYAIIQPCEMRDNGTQYPCEWGPAGGVGPLEYYGPRWAKVSAVLKGLSDGMTSVDPDIRKAMGTAGWGHLGAFERMEQDGIEWDISVWHMYGEDPEWAFEKLIEYDRPIWVTEFNHPYGSQRSEKEQAVGLARMIERLRELSDRYKVKAAHIYELLDETYWAPSFEASMGLVRLNPTPDGSWVAGEPKPAYFAIRERIRGRRSQPSVERNCDLAESKKIESLYLRQASYAYCLVVGRTAQAETITELTAALEEGKLSFPGVVAWLIRSRVFNDLYAPYSLTDREYVMFIYDLLLHRNADGYGLATYTQQLGSGAMTRESIAYGIAASSEFRDKHPDVLVENADVEGTASVSD